MPQQNLKLSCVLVYPHTAKHIYEPVSPIPLNNKQIKFVLKCLDISWQLLLLKQMSLFTVSFWVPWGFKGSMNECMLQVDWMKIHALSVRTLIFSVSCFAWVYTWSCSYSTLLVLYMSSIIFTCVILFLEESVWFTYCTPVFLTFINIFFRCIYIYYLYTAYFQIR